MPRLRLVEPHIDRNGEKIHWQHLSAGEQDCIRRAIAYYNRRPKYLAFIDWMNRQPEIRKLFLHGLRLTKAGRKSKMYEICTDLLFRITRAHGITGRTQNTPLQ